MTQIIVAIIDFVNGIISFLLPDMIFVTDLFTNFATYLESFTDFLIKVNFLVPLPTLFTCIRIMLTIKIVKFGVFVYNWVVRAILDVIP